MTNLQKSVAIDVLSGVVHLLFFVVVFCFPDNGGCVDEDGSVCSVCIIFRRSFAGGCFGVAVRSRADESSPHRVLAAANPGEMSSGVFRLNVFSRDVVCDALDCVGDSVFRRGKVATLCLKRVKKVLDASLLVRKISSKVRAPILIPSIVAARMSWHFDLTMSSSLSLLLAITPVSIKH